ncbi:TspO/MBR family protein [Roseibium sp. RKSG952]|uniref:TspO/MBR family protein n=1 Tax=Roseibium sp. RKSG952 TaxID=2529384 RepID=UPI0012BB7FF9|nr:TspO/MBR family protein [Roseibium sp. RKSG952]MTH98807.1 tryptophan-rich sensory protein [Roseibium sp. RKSG952]
MAGFVFAALVFITALSGAVFKPGPWYQSLKRPSWTPPNWAFPVVWTILYVMIAVSGWLVWSSAGWGAALVLWGVQLILNAAWSWLFFGLRRMDVAFADACAMLLAIIVYIFAAWQISVAAALLFVPYALWVSVAALLNLSVWRLNPEEVAD